MSDMDDLEISKNFGYQKEYCQNILFIYEEQSRIIFYACKIL